MSIVPTNLTARDMDLAGSRPQRQRPYRHPVRRFRAKVAFFTTNNVKPTRSSCATELHAATSC